MVRTDAVCVPGLSFLVLDFHRLESDANQWFEAIFIVAMEGQFRASERAVLGDVWKYKVGPLP